MSNLIRYEFKKTFSTKAIYICTIIAVGMTLINGYLSCSNNAPGQSYLIGILPGNMLETIIAVLVPILFCSEMEMGSMKIMVGRGYTRKNILISKIIMSNLYMIMMSVVSLLVGGVYGKIKGVDYSDLTGKGIANLVFEMLVFMIIINIAIVFSVLFQSKGAAIAATIFLPGIIPVALLVAEKILKLKKIDEIWYTSYMLKLSQDVLKNSDYIYIGIGIVIYNVILVAISYILMNQKDF